eukprot:762618-Hanusia_phi.AAC.3
MLRFYFSSPMMMSNSRCYSRPLTFLLGISEEVEEEHQHVSLRATVNELRSRERQLMGQRWQIELFHAIKEVQSPSKLEEKRRLYRDIGDENNHNLIHACNSQIVNLREEREEWKSRALIAGSPPSACRGW